MRERESERDYLQVFSWQSLNEEGRLEVWWEKIQWNSYFVPRGRKTFMSDQGVWIIVLMSEFRKKEKRKKKESESLNREEQRRVQVTWVSRQQKYSVLVREELHKPGLYLTRKHSFSCGNNYCHWLCALSQLLHYQSN